MASAVKAVRQVSGLPLVVGTPLPTLVTDPTKVPSGTITFSFVTPAEIKAAQLDMGSDVLGRGGPMVDQSGSVISGWVAIRSDGSIKPTSIEGLNTAWHELAHAVNLDHSLQVSGYQEVMEPAFDPDETSVKWGPGDKYALAAVGCTGSRSYLSNIAWSGNEEAMSRTSSPRSNPRRRSTSRTARRPIGPRRARTRVKCTTPRAGTRHSWMLSSPAPEAPAPLAGAGLLLYWRLSQCTCPSQLATVGALVDTEANHCARCCFLHPPRVSLLSEN
jgi:hypothetical protein